MNREVTLRITARPPRLLFVVRNNEDMRQAITLFSHLWGGVGNALLTVPEEAEVRNFTRALRQYDPDLILIRTEEIPAVLLNALSQTPYAVEIVRDNTISEFVELVNPLITTIGELPHLGRTFPQLFPSPVSQSNVRFMRFHGAESPFWPLLYGNPSEWMRGVMVSYFGAQYFAVPQTPEEVIWTCILAQHRSSCLELGRHQTHTSVSRSPLADHTLPLLEQGRIDSGNALNLFLVADEDLGVLTAFWNARRARLSFNSYLMPLNCITDHCTLTLNALLSLHRCDVLHVFATLSTPDAEQIHQLLIDALSSIGRVMPVCLTFMGFRYSMGPGRLTWGSEHTVTRGISQDGLVRYSVPMHAPVDGRSIFGYDCIVDMDTGYHLKLQPSGISTLLLLNSIARIERARNNDRGLGRLWIRHARRVRPLPNGLSGVSQLGEELRIYFHPDELIVEQTLLERGYTLKPNQHTRYTLGFVRRFGGMAQTITFVRGGAVSILEALGSRRAVQSGFFRDQLRSYMERELGLEPARSQSALREFLPEMLKSGIVRRGVALRCSHCDLEEWYPIDSISEQIVCAGCLTTFQLEGEGPRFKYVVNELARRFILTGGHAILRTAAVLQSMEPSGQIYFGGDLHRYGENRAFAEIDLVRIIGNLLIVAECKAYRELGEQELEQIRNSLHRVLRAALELQAQVVLLGLVTAATNLTGLHQVLTPLAEHALSEGIGLHLIANDKFYAYGGTEAIEVTRIDILRLDPNHETSPIETTIGELARSYGFGSLQSYEQDVIREWDERLSRSIC